MDDCELHNNVAEFLGRLAQFRIDDRVYQMCGDARVGIRPSRAGDEIHIMKISTPPKRQGQGEASQTLDEICGLADELGVTLFLEVERFGDGGLAEGELLDWYWRRGFRGDAQEMIREPAA